jgi:O-antigen/teichoic acid export membrane protein
MSSSPPARDGAGELEPMPRADSRAPAPSLRLPDKELTGQDRLAQNILANWASHLAVVAIGFLTPRIMDRQLGQEALGIWDLGWSLVSYLGLTRLGVGSSINRYVALYRSRGDTSALRRMTASVSAINVAAGLVALVATATMAWLLPHMIRPELASEVSRARWLVILLGTTVAVELASQVYYGVLSGCHRFDVQAGITTVFEMATSLGLILALLAGGGLVALGVVCLVLRLGNEATYFVFAHRVCPELRVRPSDASWAEVKKLLRFGLKSFLNMISYLLVIQSNKIIVGGTFGLAALAVFSRPLSLINIVNAFVWRLANVLTPTASSLHGRRDQQELRGLLLLGVRLGVALALPGVLLLVVMGDLVMRLWMGPRYEPGWVLVILPLGYLGSIALRPAKTILLGMNLHGRPALAAFAGALTSTALGILNAKVFHWGLTGAALAVALPVLLSGGVYVVFYAAQQFQISARQFFDEAVRAPLLCAIPLLGALIGSRVLFGNQPLIALLAACASGALILIPMYWRWVMPEALQIQVRSLVFRLARLRTS